MGTFYIKNLDNTGFDLGSQFYPKSHVTKGTQRMQFMGADEVELTIVSAERLAIAVGAVTNIYGRPYFLNAPMGIEKFNSSSYVYTCHFEGMNSLLERVLLFNIDKSELSFSLVGTVDSFMDIILYNCNSRGAFDSRCTLFSVNNDMVNPDEKRLISFDNDNCLTALNKIVEAYSMRYSFSAVQNYDLTYNITVTLLYKPETRQYREELKLGYGLSQIKIDPELNREFSTIIFGFGSDRNIPSDYRGYSRFLKPSSSDSIKDSDLVSQYGVYETIFNVDNIYPRSDGEVTALGGADVNVVLLTTLSGHNEVVKSVADTTTFHVWDIITGNPNIPDGSVITEVTEHGFIMDADATGTEANYPTTITQSFPNINKFSDSGMDFDLNGTDEFGTKYLIQGLSAKVAFNSGNLAGYSFVLKSYDHSTKTFEVIPITDERNLTMPDADTFNIQVGDMYVLTDINLPSSYITAAEAELRTYLETYVYPNASKPKVIASFTIDKIWLSRLFNTVQGMSWFYTDDPDYPHPTYYPRTSNNLYECGYLLKIVELGADYAGDMFITQLDRNVLDEYDFKITLGTNKYTTLNLEMLRWQDRFAGRFNEQDINKREARWTFKYRHK